MGTIETKSRKNSMIPCNFSKHVVCPGALLGFRDKSLTIKRRLHGPHAWMISLGLNVQMAVY